MGSLCIQLMVVLEDHYQVHTSMNHLLSILFNGYNLNIFMIIIKNKLVHDKLEIIANELVTSSLYSELINADNVTDYVIKFWVRDIKDDGTIWVKSFCGLIENWSKTKYNPEVDKLIIDEKASCSINNFRAVIKNISHMVLEMKGRKFRIRVDDLDTVIMLFKEGLSKIISNTMHSIVQQLRSVV